MPFTTHPGSALLSSTGTNADLVVVVRCLGSTSPCPWPDFNRVGQTVLFRSTVGLLLTSGEGANCVQMWRITNHRLR